ncbi:MAG: hypothetical protein COA74_08080 [Gammaproteobacteria bacterium]|nr:MAG: hypothetical protein COA74_08080 [Gammaproteobacteria bacterium]
MTNFEEECARKGLVARDIKNAIIVNFWILAWAVTLGAVSYLSDYQWYTASWWASSAGLLVHLSVGIGMILAFKRFVKEADDLERKIQLDALAISVGLTVVTFSSYSILEMSAVVPELTAAYLIVVMSMGYALGLIIGRIRFR